MTKAQRLAQYQNATFKFYETAGHGYLLAPKELILDLGLEFYISPFSFETLIDKKKWVYLEEDGDAGVFEQAYKAYFGQESNVDWIESLDDESFIIFNQRFGKFGGEIFMFRATNGINDFKSLERNLKNLSKKHGITLAVSE